MLRPSSRYKHRRARKQPLPANRQHHRNPVDRTGVKNRLEMPSLNANAATLHVSHPAHGVEIGTLVRPMHNALHRYQVHEIGMNLLEACGACCQLPIGPPGHPQTVNTTTKATTISEVESPISPWTRRKHCSSPRSASPHVILRYLVIVCAIRSR